MKIANRSTKTSHQNLIGSFYRIMNLAKTNLTHKYYVLLILFDDGVFRGAYCGYFYELFKNLFLFKAHVFVLLFNLKFYFASISMNFKTKFSRHPEKF